MREVKEELLAMILTWMEVTAMMVNQQFIVIIEIPHFRKKRSCHHKSIQCMYQEKTSYVLATVTRCPWLLSINSTKCSLDIPLWINLRDVINYVKCYLKKVHEQQVGSTSPQCVKDVMDTTTHFLLFHFMSFHYCVISTWGSIISKTPFTAVQKHSSCKQSCRKSD